MPNTTPNTTPNTAPNTTSDTAPDTAPGAGRPPAVRLTGVTKSFGHGHAVRDVTLDIAHNEFFSILGPSGCGKTTLMRMISGFETPTAGTVELAGAPATRLPPHRRDLNMLFQSYALFPHLDVHANVAFELKVRRHRGGGVDEAVREALALVRLDGYGGRKVGQLSGGQQQRVAIARALVSRPALLLLDEPLGALDQKLRAEMQLELKRLQREVGITFVAVTHDQEEALTMSDRIAVMNGGRVLQVGTPREIYELPATRFVADFIGTSNFLTGTLGPGRTVDVPGVGALPAPDTGLPDGAQVQLAVRPEKVRLARSESAFGPGGLALPATLRQSIYLGHGVRYHLELADGSTVVAEHRGSPDDLPAVGRPVWVGWSPAHSRVLDR